MPIYTWSQTAATNASADSTINFAEGQAPSTLNDSSRALMAAAAMWRDDISGSITTGGSATAYTVATSSVFDTLAHMSGQLVAFIPHATNTSGTSTTLAVDGLTAKPIRLAPSVEIPAGTLTLGAVYRVTYNNADGAFYLNNTGGAIGYGKGAGAVVTQGTSIVTAVTINALAGQITTFTAVTSTGSSRGGFTVNNSFVTATDNIIFSVTNTDTLTAFYQAHSSNIAAGSFKLYVQNTSLSDSPSEAPVIRFTIVRSAIA